MSKKAAEKPDINGASGVPVHGRETEYATELWLEGPSAFWLHPEGPLSDKTPEEWKAEQEAKVAEKIRQPFVVRDRDRAEMQAQLAYMQQQRAFQGAQHSNPYLNLHGALGNNYRQSLFGLCLWP